MSSVPPSIPPDIAASTTPNWRGFWAEFAIMMLDTFPQLLESGKGPGVSFIAELAAGLVEFSIEISSAIGKRVGDAVDDFEAQAGPTILKAAAAGLSDYFGTSISPGDIDPNRGFSERFGFAERLGRMTLENMFGAFQVPGPLTPDDGKTNAERIIGFNIATALESWVGSVHTLTPLLKYIPSWADLDDVMSANLGLGRANRRVIGPLLKTLIVDPFTWDLNRRFTPSLFSESQLVRLLNRRVIDQAEYFEKMSWLGWSNASSAKWLTLASTQPGKEDISRALELGLISEAQALALFEAQGFTEGAAKVMLELAKNDRVRTLNTAVENEARSMFREREIDEAELRSILKSAGRTDEEIRVFLGIALLERSRTTKLPRSIMEEGFRRGLIPLSRLSEYYEKAGYSVEDRVLLEELAVADRLATLAKEKEQEERAKGGDFLALPRGSLEQAFIDGLIGAARLTEYYSSKGYAPADAAVLLELAATRKTAKDRQLARELEKANAPKFQELPRSTIEEAFIRDVISEARLVAWYQGAGFRPEDVPALVAVARQKKAEREERLSDQLRDAGGARARELPRSVVEEAFFRDIIDAGALRAYYRDVGFDADEVAVLMELAGDRKADRKAKAAAP